MDFHHPYEPYAVQQQFMTAVYDCIDQRKIGILESPTGTGKSLSLICGSLTWLRDQQRIGIEAAINMLEKDEDEPDWILEHGRKERRLKALQHRQDLEQRLARIRENERKVQQRYAKGATTHKRQKLDQSLAWDNEPEEQFVLEDYDSDKESRGKGKNGTGFGFDVSSETLAIMKRLGMSGNMQTEQEELEVPDEAKIYYCSRTHSQLSQFASELRRVRMPATLEDEELDGVGISPSVQDFKYLTLGSRKTLCINPKVSSLKTATAINERCLELQQSKTSPDCRCKYLPNADNEALVHEFRDHALAAVRDIEDLGAIGKKIGICPYYASRASVRPTEIVTLPYPLLLQQAARQALGISLRDHVVIIDEAHNLMDAIASMYSVTITLMHLEVGRAQLLAYLQRFRNRLKGKNRVYVTQIVRLIDSLLQYLKCKPSKQERSESWIPIAELMAGKGVDQIDIHKLSTYIHESRLARKIDGYVAFSKGHETKTSPLVATNGQTHQSMENSTPTLTLIVNFLMALMNPSKEGRFLRSQSDEGEELCLRYMLLDPAPHFREIVDEARAVILAGGTMSPMDDYIKHLFPYVQEHRIMTLSCDHVIPPSNFLAWSIAKDRNGCEFNFAFESRGSSSMIRSAGRTLIELLREIPDGVVTFFSSYAYLETCVNTWKQPIIDCNNSTDSLWDEMNAIKPVFLEPRSQGTTSSAASSSGAGATEALLALYATTIRESDSHKGAVLMSVINGSLSEGINFSDDLGRAVIVFGLPYPNPNSAEWGAKMEYIAGKEEHSASGKAAARDFYENATMRAVNQAIGRAIRHRDDFANIFLMDHRYDSERIRSKLPAWIRSSLQKPSSEDEILKGTRAFFEAKRRDGYSQRYADQP